MVIFWSNILLSFFISCLNNFNPKYLNLSVYWCLAHRKYNLWISSFFTVKIGIDWILSGNGTTYNTIGAKWSMKLHSIRLFYTPCDLTRYSLNLLSSLQTKQSQQHILNFIYNFYKFFECFLFFYLFSLPKHLP